MTIEEMMRRLADEAPDAHRRVFARLVVAQLRVALLGTDRLPPEVSVPMRFADGSVLDFPLRPMIEDARTVVRLADALGSVGRDDPSIRVMAADLVDASQGVGGAGLVLFVDDRPAMAVGVAAGGAALYVRTEGFERSVVGMAGELPGLWERVRRALWQVAEALGARARRRKPDASPAMSSPDAEASRRRPKRVLERGTTGRSLALTLPAITLRRADRPIVIERRDAAGVAVPTTPGTVPLLIPIRGLKTGPGAYPPRAAVVRLRHALGVHVLLTDHALRRLLGGVPITGFTVLV